MKVRIIGIGSNKSTELSYMCNELLKRIRHFVPIEMIEIKGSHFPEKKRRMVAEGKKVLSALEKPAFAVALDPKGRTYDSTGFSKFIERHMTEDPRDLVFIIGGHQGLSDNVKKRADQLLSLSKLTFSHDLSRLILLEQQRTKGAIVTKISL